MIKNSNSKNKQKSGYIFKKKLKKLYSGNHQTIVLYKKYTGISKNLFLHIFNYLFEIEWDFLSFYESQKKFLGKFICLPISLISKKIDKKTLNFMNKNTLELKLTKNLNLKNFVLKNSNCEFFITIPQFSEKFSCIKQKKVIFKEKIFNLLKYIIFFQISNRCKILNTSNIDRIYYLVHKKYY